MTPEDGSQRYHKTSLNAVTLKDIFLVSHTKDCACGFSGAEWFSMLDLASGYWHVAVNPAKSGNDP